MATKRTRLQQVDYWDITDYNYALFLCAVNPNSWFSLLPTEIFFTIIYYVNRLHSFYLSVKYHIIDYCPSVRCKKNYIRSSTFCKAMRAEHETFYCIDRFGISPKFFTDNMGNRCGLFTFQARDEHHVIQLKSLSNELNTACRELPFFFWRTKVEQYREFQGLELYNIFIIRIAEHPQAKWADVAAAVRYERLRKKICDYINMKWRGDEGFPPPRSKRPLLPRARQHSEVD